MSTTDTTTEITNRTSTSVATDHSPNQMLLDPGMNLTLRPMRYPHFY